MRSVSNLPDSPSNRSRLPFWMALLTIGVTLIGVTVGALVTTKNAGMAFRDWPTSHGYNMFLYPWLRSTGDEFLEHGHRLAGSLIGLVSIGLVVVFWRSKQRPYAKWLAAGVLMAVICQGLLGGFRVVFDKRLLALVHGSFGASVLSLMGLTALVVSLGWRRLPNRIGDRFDGVAPSSSKHLPRHHAALGWLAGLFPLAILLQYAVGGMVRHLGFAIWEHIGGAILIGSYGILLFVLAQRTREKHLSRPANILLAVVFAQIALGIGAFVLKFGWPASGYVAIKDSIQQVVVRTSHAVVGMLLLMTSVINAARVLHWNAVVGRVATRSTPPSVSEPSPIVPDHPTIAAAEPVAVGEGV